ncbi:hypothetical protein AOE01nite_36080 [Acetobacter oeni]|uniref:DUF1285 domain-containing protein n=1 Tax=Acetobacter oeni TaxID=304077 RepID=A0A511XR35_9PROT|nr:hypothetical protein [Acetobacter oeni]GEN65384.1 hypothetical protein AOE01nite_36080 [Acetobacter oeni]
MTPDSFPAGFGSGLIAKLHAEGTKKQPHQCGKLPFLIRKDGSWLYKGSVIRRKPMVCLFASALRRAADGIFWLRTPVEEGTIEVEDAPFVVTELNWRGTGREQTLCFRTNVDAVITAGPEYPLRTQWDVPLDACDSATPPYLTVRAGEGPLPVEARISRPVWYELAALAEPGCYCGQPCLGVWSGGVFFPLARAPRGCPDANIPDCDDDTP